MATTATTTATTNRRRWRRGRGRGRWRKWLVVNGGGPPGALPLAGSCCRLSTGAARGVTAQAGLDHLFSPACLTVGVGKPQAVSGSGCGEAGAALTGSASAVIFCVSKLTVCARHGGDNSAAPVVARPSVRWSAAPQPVTGALMRPPLPRRMITDIPSSSSG
jgi:hypothetical protein